jgi:hypothetical protein
VPRRELIFVDAVDAHSPAVSHIPEHVRALRESGVAYPADFAWPAHSPPLDWADPLLAGTTVNASARLLCNKDDAKTRAYVDEGPDAFRLNAGKIACWETYLRLLHRIAATRPPATGRAQPTRASDVAIILEDDIDVEIDLRTHLEGLWSALPQTWDVVFLGMCSVTSTLCSSRSHWRFSGWCWSDEWRNDPISEYTPAGMHETSSLRPANTPHCTHAYAVSAPGACKLLTYIEYPRFPYGRAIDQAYM